MAFLLADEEQEITDLRANGSLSHFLSYFSGVGLSSPFFENITLWDCKSWVDGRIAVRNHKSGGLNLILTSNFFKQMKTLILI